MLLIVDDDIYLYLYLFILNGKVILVQCKWVPLQT